MDHTKKIVEEAKEDGGLVIDEEGIQEMLTAIEEE
jgi:hypothetical protein